MLSLGVGGCASLEDPKRLDAAKQQQLKSSLNVASASADAGQFEAAERLYREISRHYPDAPEPRLGLGYLALRNGDFTGAGRLFVEAEERSTTPAVKAAALLGAGRANLGEGDVAGAKRHFLAAAGPARSTPADAWVANGLGVVATLEGDHARARQHYDKAVKLSSAHPMITANLVRALAQSGERDEARRLYARYSASYWRDSDAADLLRLMDKGREAGEQTTDRAETPEPSRREDQPVQESPGTAMKPERAAEEGIKATDTSAEALAESVKPEETATQPTAESGSPVAEPPSEPASGGRTGVRVQLFAARSEAGALAAWTRLSTEEKDLLDSLTPSVVKAEVPEKGVFHRLRAGPLADKAAARRLCRLLERRGRDCFVPAEDSSVSAVEGANNLAGAGILVQLFAARSRADALAAWARLSASEKNLLGTLAPRVVKVRIPGKGVVYRLFAGPLPAVADAERLCDTLKDRGRECFVRR